MAVESKEQMAAATGLKADHFARSSPGVIQDSVEVLGGIIASNEPRSRSFNTRYSYPGRWTGRVKSMWYLGTHVRYLP
jgi:hypothetical protein